MSMMQQIKVQHLSNKHALVSTAQAYLQQPQFVDLSAQDWF